MAAALDAYTTGWLDLVLRWFHVTAAIVWIGTSFYFVALDNHLDPPAEPRDRERGVGGETWEIHGGGFYRIEKFAVAPRTLPEPLHWFKWEAYWTWLSGFGLFVVLYYLHATTTLIDPSVADLTTAQAVLISIGLLVAGWLVYDVLCRTVGAVSELLLAACIAGLVVLAAWGSWQLFAPRAAYLQVGAMLGTIMAANVLFVIIPAHRKLIRAKEEGRPPDPADGARGKQRSVHNNYFTLPVLFAMLAGHFPFTYGNPDGWAVLVCLMAIGAWVRVYFNQRHAGRTFWIVPVTAAAGIAGVAVWIRPSEPAVSAAPVAFARIAPVVEQRCAFCHSVQPKSTQFTSAPLGIRLDTPEEIKAQAGAIQTVAVQSRTMPLANQTQMTDAERALLGAWIAQGAKIPVMLEIAAGGFDFTARLEEDAAPQTVAAFRRLLPLESKIIHVRWSGEAGWIPFGDLDLGLGPENATCYPHAGEIVLYPGGVSETEILLAYGYVSFASKAGALAGNHFATIVSGGENLHELGRRFLWEGAQPIVFSER